MFLYPQLYLELFPRSRFLTTFHCHTLQLINNHDVDNSHFLFRKLFQASSQM